MEQLERSRCAKEASRHRAYSTPVDDGPPSEPVARAYSPRWKLLYRWGIKQSSLCDCDETRTAHHILSKSPRTCFNGGVEALQELRKDESQGLFDHRHSVLVSANEHEYIYIDNISSKTMTRQNIH